MASISNPKPGTEFGPCKDYLTCHHTDCAATKRQVESRCPYCKEPIGFDRQFYTLDFNDTEMLAHAVCYENALRRAGKLRVN